MQLNHYLDATILKPEARQDEYLKLCQDAISYNFPAVCVPPFMVELCKKELISSAVKVATVIGFPTGYQTISVKLFELKDAINRGADEIDYVVHRGYLSENDYENIDEETLAWIDICKQNNIVSKWIIESSELSYEQILKLIKIANKYKPDYLKTSTGVYGKAKLEDVKLFRERLLPEIKIKAAGGILSREIAEGMVNAGADRLGVSQYMNLVL
jgi:deoxyribose-phosphate aldolase